MRIVYTTRGGRFASTWHRVVQAGGTGTAGWVVRDGRVGGIGRADRVVAGVEGPKERRENREIVVRVMTNYYKLYQINTFYKKDAF